MRGLRTTSAAPWRRACGSASLPATTSLTSFVPSERFIDPEQTNPPGIASTSTPKFGESRSSAEARPGRQDAASRPSRHPSSGRGERERPIPSRSAPGPACRRSRPAESDCRGDPLRAPPLHGSDGIQGTVSLSSTLSAPLVSSSSFASSSSDNAGVVVAAAMSFLSLWVGMTVRPGLLIGAG